MFSVISVRRFYLMRSRIFHVLQMGKMSEDPFEQSFGKERFLERAESVRKFVDLMRKQGKRKK